MKTALETKLNELAAQVIPASGLDSFLALPFESKLTGLKVLAAIGGDSDMLTALEAI